MKDMKIKHRFVELRAQGKSLKSVADELEIGIQTAFRWESELKGPIENLQKVELDGLLERHRLTVQAQIERYGVELARITEEIKKRDLSKVSTPKLYDLMIKMDARVEEVRPALTLRDDDEIADQQALRKLVASRRKRLKSLEEGAHAGRNGNGDGTVRADDLVTLQLTTLQRLRAGTIDGRTAANEMATVNSIYKGIELADLQARVDRLEKSARDESDALKKRRNDEKRRTEGVC